MEAESSSAPPPPSLMDDSLNTDITLQRVTEGHAAFRGGSNIYDITLGHVYVSGRSDSTLRCRAASRRALKVLEIRTHFKRYTVIGQFL